MLIGFVGTIAKETGSFYPVREAYWLSPAAREAYYRNVGTGPGQHAEYIGGTQYHGRGYVQLTHVGGYQMVQDRLASVGINVDLVGNPDLLLEPLYAAHSIAIYFKYHGGGVMIQQCRAQDWQSVRRNVLGGYDADGIAKLKHAESILLPLARDRGLV